VSTPDATSITKVTWVRLSFSQAAGGLNVTAPGAANQAPPGYYMLFILNGNGVPSEAKFVRVDAAGTPTPPAAPTNLRATALSSSQINLSWTDNSTNEGGLKIERCQGIGCTTFAQIATVGAGVTSYANSGLTALMTYRYRVRAYTVTPPAIPRTRTRPLRRPHWRCRRGPGIDGGCRRAVTNHRASR
jgi:Domain of unknown function (DUF1929)